MINIGITTYNRKDFLERCLESIIQGTNVPYKLFIYDDCSTDGTVDMLREKFKGKGVLLRASERSGITTGFNTLWKVSENYNDYRYFCYLQDDTIVAPGWLKTLVGVYETQEFASDYIVGLFSGHHAPEHPTEFEREITGVKVLLKRSMRATNMIAPYTFWHKIGYIPPNNPDGSPRGFPGPRKPDGSRGRGSNMDVYITGYQSKGVFVPGAAAPTCSWKLGTYCMVIPGLVTHKALSADESTWGNPNIEKV